MNLHGCAPHSSYAGGTPGSAFVREWGALPHYAPLLRRLRQTLQSGALSMLSSRNQSSLGQPAQAGGGAPAPDAAGHAAPGSFSFGCLFPLPFPLSWLFVP